MMRTSTHKPQDLLRISNVMAPAEATLDLYLRDRPLQLRHQQPAAGNGGPHYARCSSPASGLWQLMRQTGSLSLSGPPAPPGEPPVLPDPDGPVPVEEPPQPIPIPPILPPEPLRAW